MSDLLVTLVLLAEAAMSALAPETPSRHVPIQLVVVTPETEPAPAPAPAPRTSVWDLLAQCESGGDWAINTGNGYYGGLQFNLSSWEWAGGSGYPHEASREEQIRVAERLLSIHPAGWGAWPACTRKLGLR